MSRHLMIHCIAFGLSACLAAAQPALRVEPAQPQGSQALAEQTRSGVISDYLSAWQSMGSALEQNRPQLLDRDFVGSAKDELSSTIAQQASLGMRSRYQDDAHDIRFVFYSPDGLSIELTDDAEYEVQVYARDKLQAAQRMHARYVVILTPGAARWSVRVLQASPQE